MSREEAETIIRAKEAVDGTGAPEPFEQELPDIDPSRTEGPAIYRDGTTS